MTEIRQETQGVFVGSRATVDDLAAVRDDITRQRDTRALEAAWAQTQKYTAMAQE